MDANAYELTLEQQFQMRLMRESLEQMPREQLLELLTQASRLLMLKDNVIKSLVKQVAVI